MDVARLLRSPEAMARIVRRFPWAAGTYAFVIRRSDQQLSFFGGNHSRDPANVQYRFLAERWRRFREQTAPETAIVFVEGGLRTVVEDPAEAIRRDAEGGFVTFLAAQAGIPVQCPEPSLAFEASVLADRFGQDATVSHFVARSALMWPERPTGSIGEAIERGLNRVRRATGWQDCTFEALRRHHAVHHATPWIADQRDWIASVVIPAPGSIGRASLECRDAFITGEVRRAWAAGSSLFVVFGSGHAVTQEPALRRLLG